jgi:hypothetical protein
VMLGRALARAQENALPSTHLSLHDHLVSTLRVSRPYQGAF